ncbi:hypothetical protein CSB67_3808 [Enterobacter hormaechei]|nr:hypothetical protein CSB67_3808 [Enterobacter hormaechei]
MPPALLSTFKTTMLFEQFHAGLLKGKTIHKTHNTEFSLTCEQLSLSQDGEMLHHKFTFL